MYERYESISKDPRRALRIASATLAVICLAMGAVVATATFAPSARADEGGDFCVDHDLNPGEEASCEYDPHSDVIEVETWNTDGKGIGSCASVESGGRVCSTAYGSGYDEAYCKESCDGQYGRPYVTNHNPQYNSVFTGWDYWA